MSEPFAARDEGKLALTGKTRVHGDGGCLGNRRYAEVALEAHLLQDRVLAASLLGTYISPLDGDRYGKTLIATLRSFYASRRNMAAAAARLGVGRHTVERRPHRIEYLVGCELEACNAEMELALKLAELRAHARDGGEPLRQPSANGTA